MNRIRLLIAAYLLSTLALLAGCKGDDLLPTFEEVRLYVAPQKAECQGLVPTTCLQIKEHLQDPWEITFTPINGFDWEPGFLYEILVMKREIANPPADGSSVEYNLIGVVSKMAAPAAQ